MNRVHLTAFATLFLGAFAATVVISQDRFTPARVGFIDIRKAFEMYRKRTTVEAQLKQRTEDLMTQLKKRAAEIETQADGLNKYNEGSEERRSLERKLTLERNALEYDKKAGQRDLEREARRREALLYKEISEETENYRALHGLAAVYLFAPIEADFEQKSDLDIFMGTRAVIARDETLDITKDVVQVLNSQLPPAPPPLDPTKPK